MGWPYLLLLIEVRLDPKHSLSRGGFFVDDLASDFETTGMPTCEIPDIGATGSMPMVLMRITVVWALAGLLGVTSAHAADERGLAAPTVRGYSDMARMFSYGTVCQVPRIA